MLLLTCRRASIAHSRIPTQTAKISTAGKQRRVTDDLIQTISSTQPRFSLSSESVTIIKEPKVFYDTLISMIKRARRNISLSSLYIGTEEKELVQSLHNALASNPNLTVNLHLDMMRSTRPENPSTAEFLLPLIKSFGDQRVKVHLFKTPKLKGLMRRVVPRRFDEGWGTWHAKIYAIDDEVIISGANLNSSYFTNRQDRYLHFDSQPTLTRYLRDFLGVMVPFTHRLVPTEGVESGEDSYRAQWINTQAGPTNYESQAAQALSQLQQRYLEEFSQGSQDSLSSSSDTAMFPIIQGGALGIREEERTIATLFDVLSRHSEHVPVSVDLTSGYFGLYAPYKDMILASPENMHWNIVAASPKANGFYGSKGLSGRIPEAYTWLERSFWKAAQRVSKQSGTDSRIQLTEWAKEGWTYHAKGIWVQLGDDKVQHVNRPLPTISLFGSTNLNSRSANLDTELSFLMITKANRLATELGEELKGIKTNSQVVDHMTWALPERRVRSSTMAMAKIVSGML
ncbi:CDP-diacylglycerol--glycerol-3-phosphate 3-phosphatidyltransferase [Tulasnella sp. 419]|nr:CDP-diacylglycerol--glycerol-3-phosphate 3-phosphatidyltransferase [Tulasnella sp. 419]